MSVALTLIEPPVVALSDAPIIVDELLLKDGSIFGKFNLSYIRISSTNRKRFSAEKLQQLADSAREKGIVQPILIRPVESTDAAPQRYEIIAGERRYRASIMAGLPYIPAICRAMSDHDAIELQILENLQREDPHPLEEAEGYERLMLTHGYTADQLADRLKKSRSYIYGRLKLCALALDVREPFLNDEISASTALLIARIPVPKLQSQALAEILRPQWNGDAMSYRAAALHVQSRYTLALSSAPFELADAKLLASAGACTSCPKRAGNQPILYPDVDANLCTDPDCFAEKRAAHDAKIIVLANKKGVPVLEGADATATLGDLASIFGDGNLWKLDRLAPDVNSGAEIASILNDKQLPAPKAIVKLDNGKVRKLYDKAAVQAAAEAAGVCLTREAWDKLQAEKEATPQGQARKAEQDRYTTERAERQRRAQELTVQRVALYRKVRQRAASGLSLQSLRELAKALAMQRSLPDDLLSDDYPLTDRSDAVIGAYIDQAEQGEVQMILLDLLLGEALGVHEWDLRDGDYDDTDDEFAVVRTIARLEGVDALFDDQPGESVPLTADGLAGMDVGMLDQENADCIDDAANPIVAEVAAAATPPAPAETPTEIPARKTLSIRSRASTSDIGGAAAGPVIKTKKPARTVTVPTLAYTAPEAPDTSNE